MPYVTEELWQTLRAQVGLRGPEFLLQAPYPRPGPVDDGAERSFGPVIGIVDAIRNIRGEMGIPWKTLLPGVQAGALSAEALATVRLEAARIERLSNAPALAFGAAPTAKVPKSAVAVGPGFEVRVPLAGVVDMAAETGRIDKELQKLEAEATGLSKRLGNQAFVAKAPPEVVEKDRARVEELSQKRQKLLAHRAMLAEG
jgi:valyl-tRNA synthetase